MRAIGRVVMTAGAALALAGCGHLAGHRAVPRGGETITYEATGCFGTCPAYTVTLGPDGQGIFTGEANTTVTGDRRFRATPEQARAFTAVLARVRPAGERLIEPGRRGCGSAPTDQPSIDVRWQGAGGTAHLRLYTGCRSKSASALLKVLPGLPLTYLPVGQFLRAD